MPLSKACHLIDGEGLWMGMMARRPFWQHRVVFLQPDVVDRIFVDGAIGHVGNGTADDQEPRLKM